MRMVMLLITVINPTIISSGGILANTTSGDHPAIASSGFDPSATVNRWWHLEPVGIEVVDYLLTVNWNVDEVDPAVTDPNTLQASQFADGVWTHVGDDGYFNNSLIGLECTGFGDFQIGSSAPPTPASSLSFDGVDDSVDCGGAVPFNIYPLTISAWINTTQTSGTQGVITKYHSGSRNGYNLYIENGSLGAFYFKDVSNHVYDDINGGLNGGMIADGLWHHVAFVVDNDGGRLYVDGTLA